MGLVVICTVVPILTMYEAISRLGAARFSLVASVGPVLTILLAFLLLGERLMWVQAIGGFFILASVPVLELDPPGWLSRWIERRWPNGMWSKGQVGAAGGLGVGYLTISIYPEISIPPENIISHLLKICTVFEYLA